MAGQFLELAVGFGKQRRGARDEEPHVAGRFAVQALVLDQTGIEGRHAHHHRGFRHLLERLVGVEFRHEIHGCTGEQHDVGGDEEAMSVEDRQRVDQPVIGRKLPVLLQRLGIGQQIVVGEHGALGAAGRARGIKDRRQIIGGTLDIDELGGFVRRHRHQAAATLLVQRLDLGTARIGNLGNAVSRFRRADHKPRLGIADEIVEFRQGIGGVERQVDGTGTHAGEIEHQRLRALLDLDGNAITRHHTQLDERVGELSGDRQHIPIGPVFPRRRLDERRVGCHALPDGVE